jgi:hypothetical protein
MLLLYIILLLIVNFYWRLLYWENKETACIEITVTQLQRTSTALQRGQITQMSNM